MYIKAEKISKMLGGNQIFTDLTIELSKGDFVGLVGRNGCGKTTLLQLLAECEQVDAGRIMKKKGTKLGYLHQIPSYPKTFTGLDVLNEVFGEVVMMEKQLAMYEREMKNASPEQLEQMLLIYGDLQERFLQAGGYEREATIQMIVQGLGIQSFVQSPFHLLSGGEQTKVMLGQLLLMKPDILLLDEPTNHLDMTAIEWLGQYLQTFAGAILIVSHDRHFLNAVVKKIVELEEGECHTYIGNYNDYIREKEARILREFQQYEEQQKKIKKMQEAIKRLKQWANEANPPNEAMHRRAKSMEKALARIERVKKPVAAKKMNLAFDVSTRSGKDVVVFEEVSKTFEQPLFADVSFTVKWQDHLAIVGANGTGKSTLLKMITGEIMPDNGTCRMGSNVKLGYLSQKFEYENPASRVIDVFRGNINMTEGEARHVLASFLFFDFDVFKKVRDLSGGEKMRLRLAQLMYEEVNVLILDEPTNHLDIESREVLEETLQQFEGTILAVSHDRYFLNEIFNRIAWLENNEVTIYEGNYDWASEKRPMNVIEKISKKDNVVKEQQKPRQKQQDRVDFEQEIAELDLQISSLNIQIEKEEDWQYYEELMHKKTILQDRIEKIYEQWMQEEG